MTDPEPLSHSPVVPTAVMAPPQTLRRRRVALVGLALVVGVLLAGMSVGGTLLLVRAHQGERAAPNPSRSPIDFTFAGDLRSALLPLPDGAVEIPYGSGDHSVSIVQAAANAGNPSAGRRYLESLGYRQGATIAWRDRGGNEVFIYLYQFGSDGSAGSWFLSIDDVESHHVDFAGGGQFPTINGKWYVYDPSPKVKNMGYVRAVIQQEAVFASIGVYTAGMTNIALAKQLAEQQNARLPVLGVLPTHP